MIALIWKLIVGGLWRPILAVLGALGLYAKIRSGDKAKDKLRDAKETIEAHEVRNEVENRIARERDARDKLRADWSE